MRRFGQPEDFDTCQVLFFGWNSVKLGAQGSRSTRQIAHGPLPTFLWTLSCSNVFMLKSSGMSIRPRPLPSPLLLSAVIPTAAWLVFRPLIEPVPTLPSLYTSVGFALVAFLSTLYLIPALGPAFIKAGLKGKDKCKVYNDDMWDSTKSVEKLS